jgi:hypothetical protein
MVPNNAEAKDFVVPVSPSYTEAKEFVACQAESLNQMELAEFFTTMHNQCYSHIDVEFMLAFVSILQEHATDLIEAEKKMTRLALQDPSRPKSREAKRRRTDQPGRLPIRFIHQLTEILEMYVQLRSV